MVHLHAHLLYAPLDLVLLVVPDHAHLAFRGHVPQLYLVIQNHVLFNLVLDLVPLTLVTPNLAIPAR